MRCETKKFQACFGDVDAEQVGAMVDAQFAADIIPRHAIRRVQFNRLYREHGIIRKQHPAHTLDAEPEADTQRQRNSEAGDENLCGNTVK